MVLFLHIKPSKPEFHLRNYYLNELIWLMDWEKSREKLFFSLTFISFYEFMSSHWDPNILHHPSNAWFAKHWSDCFCVRGETLNSPCCYLLIIIVFVSSRDNIVAILQENVTSAFTTPMSCLSSYCPLGTQHHIESQVSRWVISKVAWGCIINHFWQLVL